MTFGRIVIGTTCSLLLWLPTLASAQAITSYQFRVFAQGASAPTVTHAIPASEVQCGQTKQAPPSGTVPNPRYLSWDDPANAALDCRWDSGATSGPLFALPFSSSIVYEGRLSAINAAGTGPESAASNPFSRPGLVPAVLTGVRVSGGS